MSTIYVLRRNLKNIRVFLSEKISVFGDEVYIYLNRRVFVIVFEMINLTRHMFIETEK